MGDRRGIDMGWEECVGEAINNGWLTGVRHCPSPNFNSRPLKTAISLLVIHNISLPPGQFATGAIESFFCNQLNPVAHPYFATIADLQVSSHLLIDRLGGITQFVSFEERAWHAGASCFNGMSNCNDYSIGIELEGCDDVAYTDDQYVALAVVTRQLLRQYPALTPERIVGHQDIAPGRKTDPGAAFDWATYRRLVAKR